MSTVTASGIELSLKISIRIVDNKRCRTLQILYANCKLKAEFVIIKLLIMLVFMVLHGRNEDSD